MRQSDMESIQSIFNKQVHDGNSNSSRLVRQEEFVTLPVTVQKDKFVPITISELMSHQYPDEEWIIDRLIPEGLTLLSAHPASFKTWLLLDIAIAITSGRDFIDKLPVTKLNVLIVDEESSSKLLQQRMSLLGVNPELGIHLMIGHGFKLESKDINTIIKYCQKNDIKFITFDSLVRIHGGNENDAVQMADAFSKLRKFTKAGISVLVTHHNRKSNGSNNTSQDIRGSSDILAAVDCHISLKRDRDAKRLTIIQTKVRNDEEIDPIEIDIVTDDTKLDLVYSGSVAAPQSARSILRNGVLKIISENEPVNQKQLITLLAEDSIKANAKTLRSVLEKMTSAGELVTRRGTGKELLYSKADTNAKE